MSGDEVIQHAPWLFQTHAAVIGSGHYKNYPIGAVICVNENNERHAPASSPDVNYLWCSFNDPGEQLTEKKLQAIVSFAKTFKDEGVVVHCYAGSNRSSLVCALLLSVIEGIPFEEADSRVKSVHSSYNPRPELRAKFAEILSTAKF
jgi:predicted protein tyrosine phosphatase